MAVLAVLAGTGFDASPRWPARIQVFVANSGSDNVTVYDTRLGKVTATVGVGDYPTGVGAHPAGHRVYVTNESSNTVSVIDTRTLSVVATVPV
ncbi:YncE family protein [Saccharothrix sp. 6-C]|nr:beta-propeller fold lactonase family protein [Saccharothrix sp. 6-C]